MSAPFDWQSLRHAVAQQYNATDRETGLIRASHLNSVLRLTPYAMAANFGSGIVVLWAFGDTRTAGMWLWLAALTLMTLMDLANWWTGRATVRLSASPRAANRLTWHAAALAAIWAVVPVVWFPTADASRQLVLAVLTTGMLSAGGFMLSPLPRASLVYSSIFAVASLIALWLSGNPTFVGAGVMLGFYVPMVMLGSLASWQKATAQLRSKAHAERQEGLLAVLLQDFEQNAGDALWETGPDGHLTHLSARMAEWLGSSDAEARSRPLLDLLAARCDDGIDDLRRAFAAGLPFRDLRLSLAGAWHLTMNGKSLFDDEHRPLGWRGVLTDVTDRTLAERRMRQLALTDSLTGLANRFTLRDALADRLGAGRPGALLAIDLDHFKAVNDSLGHSAGDNLLKGVAQRLCECVRPGDLVARLGGDEFAVLAWADHCADAEALGRRVVLALEVPMDLTGRRLQVSASVGVVHWGNGAGDVDELMVQADVALYDAKGSGRGRHSLYSRRLGDLNRRRLDIEEGLRHAIERGQLSLHWQPQVDIRRWELIGAEALLRWDHPTLGRVSPEEFIVIAEQCGLIDDIGRWALRHACQTAAGALAGLKVSVNVSALQFRSGRFVDDVRATLRAFSLAASRLELEITESVFIDDADAALAQLHALRELGLKVALDDFGTGYSSLAYLRRFPFDTLKIDRAFVNELLAHEDARAIVRMIAQLATSMGMRTVCEGIENAQQLAAVTGAGCDEIQGYLVSPPLTLAAFEAWRLQWPGTPQTVLAA